MNRKHAIIITLALIVLLSAVLLILQFAGGKKTVSLFNDTDYPAICKQKGSDLIISLDGGKTKDLTWECEVASPEIAEAKIKGTEKKGKAAFTVTPKAAGETDVIFTRKQAVGDYEVTAVKMYISVNVKKTDKGFTTEVSDDNMLIPGNEYICASSTDYPFLLKNESDGSSRIVFLNGINDWRVNESDDRIRLFGSVDDEGRWIYDIMYSSGGTDTSEPVTENEFTKQFKEAGAFKIATGNDASKGSGKEETEEDTFTYESVSSSDGQETSEFTAELPSEKIEGSVEVSSESLETTVIIKVVIDTDGNTVITEGEDEQ